MLHHLIAVAHVERWTDERTAYIMSDEVRAELLAAAEKSIFHPDYVPAGVGWAPRLAPFALALELAEEFPAAWRAFEMLDGLVTPWPWGYFGDPVEAFTRSRDWVYENVEIVEV